MTAAARQVAWICAVTVQVVGAFPPAARAQEADGPEFQVNTYVTGSQSGPRVARQPDGRFIVVWSSPNQDGSSTGVLAQAYDAAGAKVGGELRVNTYTLGSQIGPAVAAAGDGEFVVVWTSVGQDGSNSGVFGQRVTATGALTGPEFRANTYTPGSQTAPRVAASPGGFVVVWDSAGQDGELNGIFGQCFTEAGLPVGSEFQVNSYTTQYQYLPDVAMNANGSFVVVWMEHPRRRSFGQLYAPNCTRTGGEFQAHLGLLPAVAMGAGGQFVVAGIRSDGNLYGIWAQRFASGGTPQGTEFRVNTYTPEWQDWPSVAMEPGGDFVVTWDTYNITSGVVENASARAFRANGTPAGPELTVNTYTTGPQARPAVGIDEDGNFVVAWTSASDGNGTGIAAQRFLSPDLIFADGFEAGNLAAWSSSAADGGDLSVDPAAAMAATTLGLQAVVDDTVGLFVHDDSPSDEDRYRARFYFDPNGFDPGVAQAHLRTRIFIGFEEAPNRRLFAVVLRLQNGQYALMGRARRDDNGQTNTGFFPITDAPHWVELDWRRAGGPDALDGSFAMWIDGVSVSTLTGLDNSLSALDFVRMGALSVKPGAGGTMLYDEFVSHRRTAIGAVP